MVSFKEHVRRFWMTTKYGYDTTYWIFVLVGAAILLTTTYGVSGTIAVVVVFLFFYLAGKRNLRHKEEYEKSRKIWEREHKKRHTQK